MIGLASDDLLGLLSGALLRVWGHGLGDLGAQILAGLESVSFERDILVCQRTRSDMVIELLIGLVG